MCSFPVLGEQLYRFPNAVLGTAPAVPDTLTRSAKTRNRCARKRRGHHLRCDQARASQRDTSAQLTAVLHCNEQRWHTSSNRF